MSKLLVDEISDADNTGPVTVTDGLTVQGAFTSLGIDDNATSTAMTIDSSGNVLVGKTSAGAASVGFEARANGFNAFTRDGGQPLEVRRLTSDGVLIDLRKDGTTVGSIGTLSSRLHIENGDTGLRIAGDLDQIFPCGSGGGDRDAAIDLGSTGVRFKDLYLSGGVYLGGTGAANHLDDYEEGTWTPTLAASGYTFAYQFQVGSYTKIGQMVSIKLYLRLTGVPTGSGSTALAISSLPFTIAGGSANYGSGSILVEGSDNLFTGVPTIRSNPSVTYLTIYDVIAGGSPTVFIDCSKLDSTDEFEVSMVYETAS
jgi:hypothetical protein